MAIAFATFEGMSIRFILLFVITGWATSAFGRGADTTSFHRDSTEVVEAIHTIGPWLGQRIAELENASTPEQSRRLALLIAERTDGLTSRFREVFPDDDDGIMLFGMFNGLAAALGCSEPALAAAYRAMGTAALYSGDSPYRPASYHALSALSELAWEMAHATRAVRKQHLLGQLRDTYAELVAAP